MRPLGRTILKGLAGALLTSIVALSSSAVEVRVSAAASLTDALRDIRARYEKSGGDSVVYNFGASSLLARQIEEGAPADLFLSADEVEMDRLDKHGLVLKSSRRNLLSNTLVIIVPRDSGRPVFSPDTLAGSSIRKIAVGEPSSVPAGIYAREYLSGLHLWDRLAAKVVPTENVRAALAAVESDNADAGIVYRTDALVSQKVRIAYEVSASDGPKISYPAAVISESKHRAAAQKFLDYLESPVAKEIFRHYGFLMR